MVYSYGFNGKEKDPEGLGGGGSTYDYGFRIYNPALAKFLSVDPLTNDYPELTPFQFASNNPIRFIDLDGLEASDPMYYLLEGFREYFDAAVNILTFDFNLDLGYTKVNTDKKIGSSTVTNQTNVNNNTNVNYSGWDIFKPGAYPSNPTTADMPSPKGSASNTTKVTNATVIKTKVSATTTHTQSTVKSKNGEVVHKTSTSTTVNTNTGTPVTGTVSTSQSNTGTSSTTVKGSVGPTNANIFIQNTITTEQSGQTSSNTTIGVEVSAESPSVGGNSVNAGASLEIGIKK